jgi:hypothetical protein
MHFKSKGNFNADHCSFLRKQLTLVITQLNQNMNIQYLYLKYRGKNILRE